MACWEIGESDERMNVCVHDLAQHPSMYVLEVDWISIDPTLLYAGSVCFCVILCCARVSSDAHII